MDEVTLNPNNDGQERVVDAQEGAGVSTAGTETAARTTDHQFNAAMRAARLAGKTEAQQELRRQYGEDLKGLGITNPYTGKAVETLDDLKNYSAAFKDDKLKQRAKSEGRDVEELKEEEANRKFVSKMRAASEEQEGKAKKDAEQRDFLMKDLQTFHQKYPDVDVAALEANKKFQTFAKGRLYKEPLASIYGDFVEFSTEAERAALARKQSRDDRSVGAGSSTAGTALTADERRKLDEWNRRYPELKMTAKEFKERKA